MTLLPVVVLLSGCTPQDAEVTADYAIFLAAASSENIDVLTRTGTDVDAKAGELGLTPIDCRDLSLLYEEDEEIAAARLPNVDYGAECCESGSGEECEGVRQPKYFPWLDDYAFYLNEGKVDPWRVEAVLTTEGDLQLTVHMDFPQYGDFRFGWVIDPNFQPELCVDGESGAEIQPDQGDWLAAWSEGEEGTLWHLNAGAYQINPSNRDDYWSFDNRWAAGYTFARFAQEEFYGHALDYADTETDLERPYYVHAYSDTTCSDTDDNDGDGLNNDNDPDCAHGFEGTSIPEARGINPDEVYNTWVENTAEYFANDVKDLSEIGKSEFPIEFKLENNGTRPEDGFAAGLDGWLGVSTSWVRIDNPDAIKANNDTPVTGEFQIYLEGVAAASKMFVKGTFKIDNIREDVWGYNQGTLEAVKREENNTPACGEEGLSGELYENN